MYNRAFSSFVVVSFQNPLSTSETFSIFSARTHSHYQNENSRNSLSLLLHSKDTGIGHWLCQPQALTPHSEQEANDAKREEMHRTGSGEGLQQPQRSFTVPRMVMVTFYLARFGGWIVLSIAI